MKLSYGLTIEQTQKLTMTPELIQAIRILQFSTQELDSFVQEELLENPVLEIDGKRKDDKTIDIDIQEKIKEDYNDEESYKQWERSSDREEYSYEQFVSKEETLEDYLLLQLTFSKLKGYDLKIGRYIVEAIDENGYLTTPVEQIAAIFKTDSGKIDTILDVIQTFEPIGVGARNLKECLIIQLAAKGLLDAFPVIPVQVAVRYGDELSEGHALPGDAVEHQNPSQAALSGEQPLADMERRRPAAFVRWIQPGQR